MAIKATCSKCGWSAWMATARNCPVCGCHQFGTTIRWEGDKWETPGPIGDVLERAKAALERGAEDHLISELVTEVERLRAGVLLDATWGARPHISIALDRLGVEEDDSDEYTGPRPVDEIMAALTEHKIKLVRLASTPCIHCEHVENDHHGVAGECVHYTEGDGPDRIVGPGGSTISGTICGCRHFWVAPVTPAIAGTVGWR